MVGRTILFSSLSVVFCELLSVELSLVLSPFVFVSFVLLSDVKSDEEPSYAVVSIESLLDAFLPERVFARLTPPTITAMSNVKAIIDG